MRAQIGGDFGHEARMTALHDKAFRAENNRRAGRCQSVDLAKKLGGRGNRNDKEHHLRLRDGGRVRRRIETVDGRQVGKLPAPAAGKKRRRLGFAHQDPRRGGAAAKGVCQSGSPAAAADDQRAGHARTPRPGGGAASGSSGQRGRGAKLSSSGSPWRSMAAQAIIAALSVHSQAGGTDRPNPAF